MPNKMDPCAYCVQEVNHPTIPSNGQSDLAQKTSWTIRAHHPWTIEWQASDTSTLSPEPPKLKNCRDVQLATRVPGGPVSSESLYKCDGSYYEVNDGYRSPSQYTPFWVIPVVFILCVTGCSALAKSHGERERLEGKRRQKHKRKGRHNKSPLKSRMGQVWPI